MSNEQRVPICRYFQRNSCTQGEQCPFRHGSVSLRPIPPLPNVCQHFLRGSCRYGQSCQKQHTKPSDATADDVVPARCIFYSTNSCKMGNSCRFLHEAVTGGIVAYPGSEARPVKPAPLESCKFFSQGCCTKGDSCPFFHVELTLPIVGTLSPVNRPKAVPTLQLPNKSATSKSTPADANEGQPSSGNDTGPAASAVTARCLMGARVLFGAGASIELVTTAFESCSVSLSNIPPGLSQSDLIVLLETFGHLKHMTHRDSTTTGTATVEFTTPQEAERAVAELNLTNIRSHQIVARLALRVGDSGAAILRSCKVQLSWFAPSSIAWSYYPTISEARAAERRLDGKSFNGRKIVASFQETGPGQTESFSVEIKGLQAEIDQRKFRKFCGTAVTFGKPSYLKTEAVAGIRRALETFGYLDAFDVLPLRTGDTKMKAFAQFTTATAAENAVRALHSQPQDFLRNGPLFLQVVHSIKYNVPSRLFEAIKADIDTLVARLEDCKIRYYHRDDDGHLVEPVCVRIHNTDPKALGRAKAALDHLLGGQVFTSEGSAVWHDYFDTDEGESFLQAACEACPAYVSCDRRKRCLKLFGGDNYTTLIRARILEKLDQLRFRTHVLPFNTSLLRTLIAGGLAKLETALEAASISINVIARTLTINGGEEAVRKVERAMTTLVSSSNSNVASTAADCPVCFCDASDPMKLPCGHSYCTLCLKHLLGSISGTKRFPIRCVAPSCTERIPLPVVRGFIPSIDEERVLEASFLSYIQRQPDAYRYCPTPDCQVIYRPGPRGTALRCPSCLSRICPSCHIEFHEGLTCKEHQENVSGESAFRQWRLENNVKACPKCNTDIEKNGGCNHITCAQCGMHICWVCMKTFPDADSGAGVYAHMRAVHGGIIST